MTEHHAHGGEYEREHHRQAGERVRLLLLWCRRLLGTSSTTGEGIKRISTERISPRRCGRFPAVAAVRHSRSSSSIRSPRRDSSQDPGPGCDPTYGVRAAERGDTARMEAV